MRLRALFPLLPVLCLFGVPAFGASAPAQAPVALVNASPITAGELAEELDRLLPSTSVHGRVDAQKKARLRQKALDELIVRELAYQRAKALHLKVEPAALEAAAKKIKGRYKTEKSFQEALRAEGITEKEFLRRVEKDLLLRQIYKLEVDQKAMVPKPEVRTYYDRNKQRFVLPESIQLKHIVLKNKPGKDRKKEIQQIFDRLKAGESFYDLAYKFSEDDYRVLGGDYGSIHRGQLPPQLDKVAFTAPLKTPLSPIQTEQGWHILRVDARQPQRQLPFEEVREKLARDLRQKRLDQTRRDFTRRLKEHASIQYLDPQTQPMRKASLP